MGNFRDRLTSLFFAIILLTLSIGYFATRVNSEAVTGSTSFLPIVNSKTGWVVECVVCMPFIDELAPRNTQFDSNGVLHVVYGGDNLYYAQQNPGGIWEIEIVDEDQDVSRATIALDSVDRPHIIYRVVDLKDNLHLVRYAHFNGTVWNIEEINGIGGVAGSVSLAVDSANNPHISYITHDISQSRSVIYAYRDKNSWHKSTIYNSLYSTGEHCSLALDSNDNPHITFGGGDLVYGRYDGEVWVIELFLDEGATDPAILLDENDKPHIVYGGTGLRYRYKTDLGWQYEFIDDGDEYSYYGTGINLPSFQLDSQGNPHIGYLVWTTGSSSYIPEGYYLFYYANREQGTWQIEFIDSIGFLRATSALVDNADQPQLIYLFRYELIHASKVDGTWSKSAVDKSGTIRSFSLTVDSQNLPHISYVANSHSETSTKNYKYAKPINDTWSTYDVESIYMVGVWPESSISVSPDGTVHIILNDGSCTRFGCSYWISHRYSDGLSWKYGFKSSYYGSDIDVATDSKNRVHIAHTDTYWVGDYNQAAENYDWTEEVLDDFKLIGDIAIDSSDFPVIAGYTGPLWQGGEMIIAIRSDTGWSTLADEILTSFESMALDPQDQPYFLSFFEKTGWEFAPIGYIYRDNIGWQQEIVDQAATEACQPGIAIDTESGIHLAYLRADDLIYAYRSKSGWQSSTVLAKNADYCSFDIDSMGKPYVAYRFENDLKIAYWMPD